MLTHLQIVSTNITAFWGDFGKEKEHHNLVLGGGAGGIRTHVPDGNTISSRARYDHFDTAPCIYKLKRWV